MGWGVIGPKREPITIVLLNGYNIELPSKYIISISTDQFRSQPSSEKILFAVDNSYLEDSQLFQVQRMQVIIEHSALSETSIPHPSPQGSRKTTKGGARSRRGQLRNKSSGHERESPPTFISSQQPQLPDQDSHKTKPCTISTLLYGWRKSPWVPIIAKELSATASSGGRKSQFSSGVWPHGRLPMLYNHLVALYPGTFGQHNWNHWVMKSKEDINLKRLCGNVLEKSENGSGWGRCDLNILYTCVRLTKKIKK